MQPAGGGPSAGAYDAFIRAGIQYVQGRRGTLIADPVARRKIAVVGCQDFVAALRAKKGYARVLIVCETKDLARWTRKVERYWEHPHEIHHAEGACGGRGEFERLVMDCEERDFILLARWSMLHKHPELCAYPWDVFLCDGANKAARASHENGSKRGEIVLGNPRTGRGGIKARFKAFMDDRPIRQSLLEVWSLGNALAPGVHGTFPEFVGRYLRMDWNHRGHRWRNDFEARLEGEMPAGYIRSDKTRFEEDWKSLQADMRTHYMLRRPVKEAMRLVDPKARVTVKGRSKLAFQVLDAPLH